MDFLKILKSFEELVFEVLTWIVLLPRTLYRILRSPLRMSAYAASQLQSKSETRFSAAISPPLLLILCVLSAHGFDMALRTSAPALDGSLAASLLASEQNLLLYRTIAFGIWALVGSVYFLTRMKQRVDRETLRLPFYEHCYLVAPFALMSSIGLTLVAVGEPWAGYIGALLSVFAAAWFWAVQIAWMRQHTALPLWRCVIAATLVCMMGSLINGLLMYVLVHVHGLG